MTTIAIKRREARQLRHYRVRSKVTGTAERPRLCVYRSLSHIYAQLVDDAQGRTLLTVSSLTPEVREKLAEGKLKKSAVSTLVGQVVARKAIVHNDYASLPHRKGMPVGHAPVVRELLVPVLRKGLVTAIIGVGIQAVAFDRGGYLYHGRVKALADGAREGGLKF